MVFLCLVVIFLCLARSVHAEKCKTPVTNDHLKYLDEMIDAQLNTCSKRLKLLDNKQVKGYCYERGVISQLSELLEELTFKPNSQSYNHTKSLNSLYNQRFEECIGKDDYVTQEDLLPCSRYIDLSPAQILEKVKTSFVIFQDFKANSDSDIKCYKQYSLCKEDHITKGTQCACPSPTTSLSNLSEIKSSPYASTIPFITASLTDYMSTTDSQNLHQSLESIKMSSVILTSMPSDVQPLSTIMEHLHAATTDRLVSDPETTHTKMDMSLSSLEFTKGITESTYTMGLSQTRTFPEYSKILGLNTDGSHTETLSTATTVLNRDSSQLTRELTSVTEPTADELLGTTEPNIVSQSSVSDFQKHFEASVEPGIESSSSSTVTKLRRSVGNVDKTLMAYASTHAQPVLSSDDSATKSPHLTSSIPPTFKSLQTMSQESEIRNLGWAASYLFPTMLTTMHASFGAEISSPVSEVQSLPSETSLHPKLTAHKGGYTYNNNQQQEKNVAAFISEDRENRGAGPIHGNNLLPILETEQQWDGRWNTNVFLLLIPSILAIFFLCGLLYFMHRYRVLRRQQNREVIELPELRPLHCELQNV